MRVLHVTGDTGLGGVETYLACLAEHRDVSPDLHHEFAVTAEGPLTARLERAGARVHAIGRFAARAPLALLRARRRLRRILAAGRFDVAIVHQYPYLAAAFADLLRRHGCATVRYYHNEVDRGYWIERLLVAMAHDFPDLSIYNSEFTRREFSDGRRSSVLHFPVADGSPVLPRERRGAIREALATGPDEPVVIQVSRMAPRKGHRRHLRALGRLQHLPWTCWVVGGPDNDAQRSYLESLKALGVELGIADRVRFLGARTDVPELLAAADLFCHPNTLPPEPFGIVYVEALYAGLPVITSAMGGALEIVDETCGILVGHDDDGALVEALSRLLTDVGGRNAMAGAARSRARALFAPALQIPRLEAELRSLVVA